MTCPTTCTHPRVTLSDGRETCTWSEDWRNETEAMHVCNLPTLLERRQYLIKIQQKRGDAAWLKLRGTVERVWKQRPAGGGT